MQYVTYNMFMYAFLYLYIYDKDGKQPAEVRADPGGGAWQLRRGL